MKDDSYKVGCSISKYSDGDSMTSLMACNYGVGNISGQPIYKDGATASECTSGTNPEYPGLCSADEVYEAVYIRRDF